MVERDMIRAAETKSIQEEAMHELTVTLDDEPEVGLKELAR